MPLAEAWDSGARQWRAGTRKRFANDLGDPRPLVAVTDNVNQAKSDQDPAEWMPALGKCRYVREWVAVKIRWRLTVNRPEKRTLRRRAGYCANTVLRVRRATVRKKNACAREGTQALHRRRHQEIQKPPANHEKALNHDEADCKPPLAAGYEDWTGNAGDPRVGRSQGCRSLRPAAASR